jgi:hypothetical protein
MIELFDKDLTIREVDDIITENGITTSIIYVWEIESYIITSITPYIRFDDARWSNALRYWDVEFHWDRNMKGGFPFISLNAITNAILSIRGYQ